MSIDAARDLVAAPDLDLPALERVLRSRPDDAVLWDYVERHVDGREWVSRDVHASSESTLTRGLVQIFHKVRCDAGPVTVCARADTLSVAGPAGTYVRILRGGLPQWAGPPINLAWSGAMPGSLAAFDEVRVTLDGPAWIASVRETSAPSPWHPYG